MAKKAPSLALSHLSPFCSVTLWTLDAAEIGRDEVVDRVVEILPSAIRDTRQRGERLRAPATLDMRTVGNWRVGGTWHAVERTPSWLQRQNTRTPGTEAESLPSIRDLHNHLTLFLASDTMAACLTTDTRVRPPITEFLKHVGVKAVSPDLATNAYLTGSARQLWMRGVHQPVSTKADAKSLIGPDLRDAIDPFGDQTFTLEAAVSAPRLVTVINDLYRELPAGSSIRGLELDDALGRPPRDAGSPIGYSVRKGTLWSRSTASIRDLTYELDRLVRMLAMSTTESEELRGFEQHGYSHLLQAESAAELGGLGKAIDFSLFIDDLEPEQDRDWDVGDETSRRDWIDHGTLRFLRADEEHDSSCAFVAADYDGEELATLRVQPILLPGGRADVNLTVTSADSARLDDDPRIEYPLTQIRSRAAIWFDNGRAIRDGHVYRLQYRDVPFDRWRWLTFDGYDTHEEKPEPKLWEHDWQGRSLFDYVVTNAETLFDINAGESWYLFCDDGSLEIADFIFVNADRKQLRLVHVKATSSATDRDIAPGKYEVVVSQAEKNVRFADPKILATYLRERPGGTQIENVCWHNGDLIENRGPAIAAIDDLGAFPDRGIIVFQPHTTKTVWAKTEEDYRHEQLPAARQVQFLRLKTLLAGLDDVCRRVGAGFEAIGHDNTP